MSGIRPTADLPPAYIDFNFNNYTNQTFDRNKNKEHNNNNDNVNCCIKSINTRPKLIGCIITSILLCIIIIVGIVFFIIFAISKLIITSYFIRDQKQI
jgi:hypothetical protein